MKRKNGIDDVSAVTAAVIHSPGYRQRYVFLFVYGVGTFFRGKNTIITMDRAAAASYAITARKK